MKNQNTSQKFDVWQYKPWWCQPWSILLTGITVVGGSWVLLHVVWLSAVLALPIALWWYYFLIIYPRMAQKMYE